MSNLSTFASTSVQETSASSPFSTSVQEAFDSIDAFTSSTRRRAREIIDIDAQISALYRLSEKRKNEHAIENLTDKTELWRIVTPKLQSGEVTTEQVVTKLEKMQIYPKLWSPDLEPFASKTTVTQNGPYDNHSKCWCGPLGFGGEECEPCIRNQKRDVWRAIAVHHVIEQSSAHVVGHVTVQLIALLEAEINPDV